MPRKKPFRKPAPESAGVIASKQVYSAEVNSMGAPKLYPLLATTRVAPHNARVVGEVDPQDTVNVTVYVRPNPATPSAFDADPVDLTAVEAWAGEHELRVEESSSRARSVQLSGTAQAMSRAFDVELKKYEHPTLGRYRGRVGPVKIPTTLVNIVEAVFGLDNRRMGRSYLRKSRRPIHPTRATVLQNIYVAPEVAKLYNFPENLDGTGQCIAILAFNGELGDTGIQAPGGFDSAILEKYFQALNLKPPQISQVIVHGPGNTPGDGSDPDDSTEEILLDLQVCGGIAPGAKLVVYFTEFTEQGWVDAISKIVTDDENRPGVISCSYGNPEDDPAGSLWTKAAIIKIDECFRMAAANGKTICCASGDLGARDEAGMGVAHTDFPASSPWVLGCGGTRLESANGTISRETVWNDLPEGATGGGVSNIFALPDYQRYVSTPRSVNPGHQIGRAVPDVAALADPSTGLLIVGPSGDFEGPIGGTSVAAPLWAALMARLGQAFGQPLGFINPVLYMYLSNQILNDVTEGNNGRYSAGPGYDACTGLGSPNGVKLLQAFALLAQANGATRSF
jgi:kumamolisin